MAIPLLPVITGALSLGKTILGGWAKRKQAKVLHKIKMSELSLELREKRLQAEIDADISIDKINTENMQNSWKDEFLLLIFSMPVILCFIPGCDIYVLAGFNALSNTPVWFQVIYLTMALTIYGHRKLAKLFANRFLGGSNGKEAN